MRVRLLSSDWLIRRHTNTVHYWRLNALRVRFRRLKLTPGQTSTSTGKVEAMTRPDLIIYGIKIVLAKLAAHVSPEERRCPWC